MITNYNTFNEKKQITFNDIINAGITNPSYVDFMQNHLDEYISDVLKKSASNSAILKLILNNDMYDPKIKEHLSSLQPKMWNNNLLLNKIIIPAVKLSLSKVKCDEDQKSDLAAMKKDIDNLSLKKEGEKYPKTYGAKYFKNNNLVNILWADRVNIFTWEKLEEIFIEMHTLSIKGFIAEKSMRDFLKSKNKKILDTDLKDDIYKGIDITSLSDGKITTFQVKAVLDIAVLGDSIQIKNSFVEFLSMLKPSQKFNVLLLVSGSNFYIVEKESIKDIKDKKNGKWEIVLKPKTDLKQKRYWNIKWETNYKDLKTETVLDDIFSVIFEK